MFGSVNFPRPKIPQHRKAVHVAAFENGQQAEAFATQVADAFLKSLEKRTEDGAAWTKGISAVGMQARLENAEADEHEEGQQAANALPFVKAAIRAYVVASVMAHSRVANAQVCASLGTNKGELMRARDEAWLSVESLANGSSNLALLKNKINDFVGQHMKKPKVSVSGEVAGFER